MASPTVRRVVAALPYGRYGGQLQIATYNTASCGHKDKAFHISADSVSDIATSEPTTIVTSIVTTSRLVCFGGDFRFSLKSFSKSFQ